MDMRDMLLKYQCEQGEDGPPVVRNAGGRVNEDALRSIRTLAGITGNGRNTIGVGK